MTIKGVAVMASLTHWCFNIVDNVADGKCYHENCPNYLRDVLIDKTATDEDLLYGLALQKKCLEDLGEPSWKSGRIQKEMNYLA